MVNFVRTWDRKIAHAVAAGLYIVADVLAHRHTGPKP